MAGRLSNNMMRRLAKMLGHGDDPLTIGLAGEISADTGKERPGSLRVVMARNGFAMMMTPHKARTLAEHYEKQPKELKRLNLEWIPQTLRETADKIDAKVRQNN